MMVKKLAHSYIIDTEELNLLGLPAENANSQEEELLDELRLELLKTKGNIIELLEFSKTTTKKASNKQKTQLETGEGNENK